MQVVVVMCEVGLNQFQCSHVQRCWWAMGMCVVMAVGGVSGWCWEWRGVWQTSDSLHMRGLVSARTRPPCFRPSALPGTTQHCA